MSVIAFVLEKEKYYKNIGVLDTSESLMLKRAISVAQYAHRNQVDKGNSAYIEHPLGVSAMLMDIEERIVALLHDVVEDSDVTLDELSVLFSDDIVTAVKLLTRKTNEDYSLYIKNISKNEVAKRVKMADLCYNMDLSRLPEIKDKDRARIKKYKDAYSFLLKSI